MKKSKSLRGKSKQNSMKKDAAMLQKHISTIVFTVSCLMYPVYRLMSQREL